MEKGFNMLIKAAVLYSDIYVWEPPLSLQGKNSLFTLLSEIQLFKDERFYLVKSLINLIIKYHKRLFVSHKLKLML